MQLKFIGSSKFLPRKLVRTYVPWVWSTINFPEHIVTDDNLTLLIQFRKFTCGHTGFASIIKPNKSYMIEIDSRMDQDTSLMILGHELVHIHQFITGQLVFMSDDVAIWHGATIDCRNLHYYDYPWEIDAAGREHGLAIRFKEQHFQT